MNQRIIPGKLLVKEIVEQNSIIIDPQVKKKDYIKAEVYLSGAVPEGEFQPVPGDLIQCSRYGQKVRIDDLELLLISYSQIFYFY